jgi:RNA binding exosome subunit
LVRVLWRDKLPLHLQDLINFIPSGITIFIFLAFLKVNKDIKKFQVGKDGIIYETKDSDSAKIKNTKDIQQDNNIKELVAKLEELEQVIRKDVKERTEKYTQFETRLDKQYEYVKEAALKSCAALVFSDNVPLVEFLDAVFTSLYLGNNGNTISRVTKRIVKSKETLETYNSELSKFRKTHKKTSKYFEDAIEQIHKEWH